MRENTAAMDILGARWMQWRISDRPGETDNLTERIASLECDLLIAPAVEEGGHAQHNTVGSLAQIVGCEIIQYMTYTRGNGRSTSANEVSFEPDWPVAKLQALACYRSQIAHPATRSWFVDYGLREWVA